MRHLISLLTLILSMNAQAKNFEKQHYIVIKSIVKAADKVEVPRELLLAICWSESSFRTSKDVTHIDGETPSYGICQVKLETAEFMDKVFRHKIKATAERLENPYINAFYAAKYLRYQLKRYGNNWQYAIDAYNKGSLVNDKSEYVKMVQKSLVHVKTKITTIQVVKQGGLK